MASIAETTPGGRMSPREESAKANAGVGTEGNPTSAPDGTAGQGINQEELEQQLIDYYQSTGSGVPSWIRRGY